MAKEVIAFDIEIDSEKDSEKERDARKPKKYTRADAVNLFAEIKTFLAKPAFEPIKPLDDFKLPFLPNPKSSVVKEDQCKTKDISKQDCEDLFERMRPKSTGAYLNSNIPLPKTKVQAQELFAEIATFLDNSLPPFRLTELDKVDSLREKFTFPKRTSLTTTFEQEINTTKQFTSSLNSNRSRQPLQNSKFTPKFPDPCVWKAFGVKTKATDETEFRQTTPEVIRKQRALKDLSSKKRNLPESLKNTRDDNKKSINTTTTKRFNPRWTIKNFSFENVASQARVKHEKIKKLKEEKRMMKIKEERKVIPIYSNESESGYSSGSVPSPNTSISSPSVVSGGTSSCNTISSVRHVNPNGEEITIFNSRDYFLYRQQARKITRKRRGNSNPLKFIVEGERPAAIDQHQKVLDWQIRQLEANEQCPMTPPHVEEGNKTPIPVDNQTIPIDPCLCGPLVSDNHNTNPNYYDFLGLESLDLDEPFDVGQDLNTDTFQPASPTATVESKDFERLLDEHIQVASQDFTDFDLNEFFS